MKVVGVNGINTHGEGNIDVLLAELAKRGHETVDVRLPKRHVLTAYWGAEKDSRLVVDAAAGDAVLVAHSFGCLRAAHAMRTRRYKAVFLIAPAMSKDWVFDHPQRVYCYCSSDDWIVALGSIIPFHPFGKAGTEGFDQLHAYGHNYAKESDHDDYFKGALLRALVDHIDHVCRMLDNVR